MASDLCSVRTRVISITDRSSAWPIAMWSFGARIVSPWRARSWPTFSMFALADLVHAGAQSLGMGASQQARAPEAIPEIVITVLLPLGVGIFCSSFVVAALCRSHRSEQAVIGSSDSKHPKTTSLPGAMSASAIAGLGLTLITLALIARFTLDNLMDTYANYVGVSTELGTDLQFSAASYLTGALNMLLLPLGIGFFCSSLVVAALPHSRRHDRAAVNQPRPDTDINQE